MRSDEEMLRAAQANVLMGGVVDAMAFEDPGATPNVQELIVLWTERDAEGGVGGRLIGLTREGLLLDAHEVVEMLLSAIGGAVKHLGHGGEEDTGDEPD